MENKDKKRIIKYALLCIITLLVLISIIFIHGNNLRKNTKTNTDSDLCPMESSC